MTEKYDVAIVGAGCAGTAAAKKSAELGLKTIFFDKSKIPGQKNACGSNITLWAVLYAPYVLDGPIERVTRGHRCYYYNKDGSYSMFENYANVDMMFGIHRVKFDAWHADLAVKAGATLKTATTVMDATKEDGKVTGLVLDNGDKIEAKIVIDAGGAHSIVSRKLGILKKRPDRKNVLYATAYCELGDENLIEERFQGISDWLFSPMSTNYCLNWMFPMKTGFHLGVGGGYMTPDLDIKEQVRAFFELDAVKRKTAGGKITYWGLRCDPETQVDNPYDDGIMVTGHAGGFVQPFIGEGMGFAFLTGVKAAETAAEAIEAGDTSKAFLAKYMQKVNSDPMYPMSMALGLTMKETFLKHKKELIGKRIHPMSSWGASPLPFLVTEALKERDFSKLTVANNMFMQDMPSIMNGVWMRIKQLRGES